MFQHRAITILQQAFSCSPSFYTCMFLLMHERHLSQFSPTMFYKSLSWPQCDCEFNLKLESGHESYSVSLAWRV